MWIFQEFAVICWYYFLFVRSHIFLPDTTMSGFFCPFFNVKLILAFSFLPISTAKTDMSVSEVPIPKNVILALARGSHLRRVFPVPRDYRWQSNTVPITGSEVQPKEGFHYAKQWQSEDSLYLRSQHIWRCDGDCLDCEYHVAGDITSLDQPLSDGNGTLGDYMHDRSKSMEEIISDRMLLEQLFARLRELDPDADTIIQCWLDDYKISDRAIAEKLGRKQRTFADQMKKIRTELRKIRGY